MTWGDAIGTRRDAQSESGPSVSRATGDAVERARRYVERMPEAISGQGGHVATWNVARKLADFGLSESEILSILVHDYNPRCEPPWSERELVHKASDAFHKREPRPMEDRPFARSNGNGERSHAEPPPINPDDPGAPEPDAPPDESSEGDKAASGAQSDAEPAPGPAPEVKLVTLASLIGPALARAERRRTGEEKPVPVPFHEWADALGGGWWPGAHFVIGGTGTGKSQITIQSSLGAAKCGIPTCYVGLELDEMQIALRVTGEQIGMRWSSLYLGRCTEAELTRAAAAVPALDGLPFYVDFGPARGWPASRLAALCEGMRRKHTQGPLLVVLDYLQLVGDEPGDFQRRPDLRERIGGAAYAARDVARRYDASVVMLSSAARNHYGLLAGDFQAAGLTVRKTALGASKAITHPHVLLGIGKESGELEYSADTSTVLLRWPARLEDGSSVVLVAVPKIRAGVERWSALTFSGGRFGELPIANLEELPAPPKRGKGAGREPLGETELEQRVLDAASKASSEVTSRSRLALRVKGRKAEVLAAIERLIGDGRLEITKLGAVVPEKGNR